MTPGGKLLTIPEFKGMSTNAPKGTVLAPELLLNAHLDRQGGYTPMYARSRKLSDVTAAVTAGVGNDLFVTRSDGNTYYAQFGSTLGGPIWAGSVGSATPLMPGLLLSDAGDTYVLTNGTATASGAASAPSFGDNASTADLRWSYVAPGPYDATVTREWLLVFERGGTVTFTTGAGVGTPPAGGYGIFLQWFSTVTRGPFAVYTRTGGTYATWQSVGASSGGDVLYVPTDTPGMALPPTRITPRTATYHKGRVFITGTADYTQVQDYHVVTTTENQLNRLYFSEIIASVTTTSLPRWSPLNFIDVPFKASREIVALASVGPYLYVFGDRELLILTGDPATDASIESVGDSIGAVDEGSVQQLSGTVFWRSDSGVMAVTGGQVREVGGEVRDMILSLGSSTTTVDFRREQYVITDGTTMLSYHAREGGWTQRSIESGGTPSLIYGGGTPYMQQGTTLYSIGGEVGPDGAPGRLQMRVRWPRYELGDWLHRKTFDGIAFGCDLATQSATLVNLTTVDASTQLDSAATITVTPGNRGVKLHTVDEAHINLTGVTISVEVTLDTQDSRGILRPPLVVYGTVTSDEDWGDNGF